MDRAALYSNNHTELVANTPAAIGPGAGVRIRKIVITATLTGTLTVSDSNTTASSTPLVLAATTPALGTIFELNLRMKNGCWVVPGSAGTCSVYWD